MVYIYSFYTYKTQMNETKVLVGDLKCDSAKGRVHSSVLELRLDKPLPEESIRIKTILKR